MVFGMGHMTDTLILVETNLDVSCDLSLFVCVWLCVTCSFQPFILSYTHKVQYKNIRQWKRENISEIFTLTTKLQIKLPLLFTTNCCRRGLGFDNDKHQADNQKRQKSGNVLNKVRGNKVTGHNPF